MSEDDDRRFRELMGTEFGTPTQPLEASSQPVANSPADPQDLFEWIDPNPSPEPEPQYTLDNVELTDEDYLPSEPRPPAGSIGITRWSGLTKLGVGLLAYGILTGLFSALLIALPNWLIWTSPAAFLGGLALLLTRLPGRRPPDDDGGVRL